ncbi:MAG: CAP domain-containing protein [Oscillospiraceae bacterium]|nr:CAP domain-containing protein [Oscillospiraceae bacterium]
MKRISSVLAVVLALALLCGAFALPAAAVDTTGFAAQVASLCNAERAAVSKPPLSFGNSKLNAAAMKRAQEFAANPSLGHTRPGNKNFGTVLAEYGVTSALDAGENLAWGQATPAQVVSEWMASTHGHREAILGEGNTFNWFGVAVCEREGTLYWAILFITSPTMAADGDDNPAGGVVEPVIHGDNEGIFGTKSKYNQWYHYILFFLCFGWIWMWF